MDYPLPAPCVVCGKLPRPICSDCTPSLEVFRDSVAGFPLFFAGRLEQNFEKVITSYKDSQRLSLQPLLPGMLNHVVLAMQREHPFDCCVIPPSNKANFRRRGFHPIEQLTRGSALKKIARVYSQANRKIADQRTLAARESAGNTAMAFSVPSGHGDLLLVDDVLTTGATMAELGRAATNAGYRIRGICVIARG